MATTKDTIEYIKYEPEYLPDVETYQDNFDFWKSIEKLDPNIHIKPGLWWVWWWHIIQDEWVVLPKRANLDFIWENITVTDDQVNNKTKVVIDVGDKQETLVSWTNIKTINWNSVLWSWNLSISVNVDPYWRDSNWYFQLPVWNSMYL